jgi:hypothetical protein
MPGITRSDIYGNLPGQADADYTYENEFAWGPSRLRIITGGVIDSGATDPGNTPTFELRPGLILGQKTTTGTWTNYAAGNTDGSQVAAGVLLVGLRMQDFSLNVQNKFYGILVSGLLKSARLIGLDNMARAQMAANFLFDDPLMFPGARFFPWMNFVTKTANYAVLSTDNFTLFDNTGAGGEVDFTLPAIANGYFFGFRVQTGQVVKVISNEGANMVAFNNNAANSVAFSTGGQEIGGVFWVYSNPAANKWIVENHSAGTNTVTVA